MYEDLGTYKGDVEHDMWVDEDYHKILMSYRNGWVKMTNSPLTI